MFLLSLVKLCVFSILYFYTWIIMMLKHRSNVQGNEENSNRKPVFNKSVSIKRLSESVNIATVKRLLLRSETDEFPYFAFFFFFFFFFFLFFFFFGIKNVMVGWSIGNTHFFFFLNWPHLNIYKNIYIIIIIYCITGSARFLVRKRFWWLLCQECRVSCAEFHQRKWASSGWICKFLCPLITTLILDKAS